MQPFLPKNREKKRVRIAVPPLSAAAWALLLCMGGKTGAVGALAALFHEGGHLLAMSFTGSRVGAVTLLPLGIGIERAPGVCSYRDDFFVFAGGIAVNLALFFLGALFPLPVSFREANLWHALFSLLPLPPLDGCGMLRSVLFRFLGEERAEKISFLTGLFFYIPLLFFSLFLLWEKGENPSLLLLCTALGYSLFFTSETDG